MRIISRVLPVALLAATFALASAPRRRRTCACAARSRSLDGNTLMVKSREGADLKLALKDNVRVGGVVKASLGDVKPETNVAITSRPRPDGTLEAVELRIFPAGQPFNSFHGDWDLMPNSFMTNGSLQTSVAGVDGQVLTVKYKVQGRPDEEKKIVVTPKTIVATTVRGHQGGSQAGPEGVRCGCAEAARRLARRRRRSRSRRKSPRRNDAMATRERKGGHLPAFLLLNDGPIGP